MSLFQTTTVSYERWSCTLKPVFYPWMEGGERDLRPFLTSPPTAESVPSAVLLLFCYPGCRISEGNCMVLTPLTLRLIPGLVALTCLVPDSMELWSSLLLSLN